MGAARLKLGRSAQPTLLIVDAQSVKNTDTAALKGYDAGKKVSGIKRHIAVDTQGLPHAVQVTTAEVTDRKGALQAIGRCKAGLGRVQSVLTDSCSGQVILDSLIGFFDVDSRSKALGDRLPSFE